MIALNHYWTDDQLELVFSFSRFPCRVQNGTDELVVTFTPRTVEEAQSIKEQMEATLGQINKLLGTDHE